MEFLSCNMEMFWRVLYNIVLQYALKICSEGQKSWFLIIRTFLHRCTRQLCLGRSLEEQPCSEGGWVGSIDKHPGPRFFEGDIWSSNGKKKKDHNYNHKQKQNFELWRNQLWGLFIIRNKWLSLAHQAQTCVLSFATKSQISGA